MNMYTRDEYLTSGNGQKAYAAQCLDSIEWNKKVGGDIANELHKKLLPYYSEFVMPYLNILPLLESGYLGTVNCFYIETRNRIIEGHSAMAH